MRVDGPQELTCYQQTDFYKVLFFTQASDVQLWRLCGLHLETPQLAGCEELPCIPSRRSAGRARMLTSNKSHLYL